jgi:hypothetical protein
MIYPREGKKDQPKAGDCVLAAERVRAEAPASPDQTRAFDLAYLFSRQALTNWYGPRSRFPRHLIPGCNIPERSVMAGRESEAREAVLITPDVDRPAQPALCACPAYWKSIGRFAVASAVLGLR